MSDYDMPSMFCETFPRARKRHRCCECYTDIPPGEVYQRIVGVWCNDFTWFKICSTCQDLRTWLHNHDTMACFGELYETIQECDQQIPPLLQLAMQAK